MPGVVLVEAHEDVPECVERCEHAAGDLRSALGSAPQQVRATLRKALDNLQECIDHCRRSLAGAQP